MVIAEISSKWSQKNAMTPAMTKVQSLQCTYIVTIRQLPSAVEYSLCFIHTKCRYWYKMYTLTDRLCPPEANLWRRLEWTHAEPCRWIHMARYAHLVLKPSIKCDG